jgi:holo-[acyl-carrier protein] synthase
MSVDEGVSMNFRVGIDLASVGAVRDSIDRHADRYLERIYTEAELRDCGAPGEIDAERLASRFAVKEAAMKVLRPSADDAVPWSTIEVHRDPIGTIDLELSGRAAELARDAGISGFEASLTHEADFAAAVVIAELEPAERS